MSPECSGDTYEAQAPTAANDRVCEAVRVCTETEWESVAPAYDRNRVCSSITECEAHEQEVVPPSATSDRQCASLVGLTIFHNEGQGGAFVSSDGTQCSNPCDLASVNFDTQFVLDVKSADGFVMSMSMGSESGTVKSMHTNTDMTSNIILWAEETDFEISTSVFSTVTVKVRTTKWWLHKFCPYSTQLAPPKE